jgi:hypothetical protein
MMRKNIIVKCDEIVIGSSLEAVIFAFNERLPIFYTAATKPFRFDYLSPEVDMSCLKFEDYKMTLDTSSGDKIVGLAKTLLWERLIFIMSLNGQVPLSNLCASIRFDGERFVFSDEYAKLIDVQFNKCHYFGDKGCVDFSFDVDNNDFICYDWVAFNRGGKHKIDFIETEDQFVKSIWFYPSDRIDGNTLVKDACAVSYLNKEQVSDFDFSETMARFKVVHEMEKRGMKGVFNGYGPNGRPKHYKFRTSYITRRMEQSTQTNKIETETICSPEISEKDLLEVLPTCSKKYSKILKYL